jgi:hypothetical protein
MINFGNRIPLRRSAFLVQMMSLVEKIVLAGPAGERGE